MKNQHNYLSNEDKPMGSKIYKTLFVSIVLLIVWWGLFYWTGFLFWEDPSLASTAWPMWVAFLLTIPFVIIPIAGLVSVITNYVGIQFRYTLRAKNLIDITKIYVTTILMIYGLGMAVQYFVKTTAPLPKTISTLVELDNTILQDEELTKKVFFLPDNIEKEDIVSWNGKELVYISSIRTAEIHAFYHDVYTRLNYEGDGVGGRSRQHFFSYRIPTEETYICVAFDPSKSLVTVSILEESCI